METQPHITDEQAPLKAAEGLSAPFDERETLQALKHYLPAQAPLKDFIHHNTLHAFQHLDFHQALREASEIFGYKTSLSLKEFRALHREGRIREDILDRVIAGRKEAAQAAAWKEKMITAQYESPGLPRIGTLRRLWKQQHQTDLDATVHPILFRMLCSYLDQGISIWNFPVWQEGFLASVREMERISFSSFFRTQRARKLLLESSCETRDLLQLLVGDESLYSHYLFDQQFAHQGWSGIVSAIEDQPQTLLDARKISLRDLIVLELLLEIDALDLQLGKAWAPLATRLDEKPGDLFAPVPATELQEVLATWQEALEWTYYDQVLAGLQHAKREPAQPGGRSFQVMFCIDDRACSLRRYLEQLDPRCGTYGTPGFFGVEFFFRPDHGKFHTKLCPAPVTPRHLIKEVDTKSRRKKDVHLGRQSHSLFGGWLISQTLGFWAALRLLLHIFRPAMGPAAASSHQHMDKLSRLTIENTGPDHIEDGLQVGFTVAEMADRVEGLLKSIGLVKDFASIVYMIGHGSSSVNNPHYAAYDCGACSGRPGSVNARVACFMANHPSVRSLLADRGLVIPPQTQFVGGLHDTTRDEIVFFDEHALTNANIELHQANERVFAEALDLNAKERSRRFMLVDTKQSAGRIHALVKRRSVSLFEPRPELNHATNALCIVGRRELTRRLFLDRRAFMNSFDYRVDPEGRFLSGILKAVAPVCGGINLEYFFSRVDNQKLGAGTKLPHNVMGLFGVANGIEGDLRPGLPSQMIEMHDPVRLLTVVEHFPEVVLKAIQHSEATWEWFIHEWVRLVVVHPDTGELLVFTKGAFIPYRPLQQPAAVADLMPLLESSQDNLPVHLIP